MESFSMPVQVRWSDLDPNFHLRHSVFYDWGAMCRVDFFERNGLTATVMEQMQFGPIILREECVFRKEIRLGDAVSIDMALIQSSRNFTRWSIQHKILKQEGMISAVLTIDGAWLDTVKRKLTAPKEKAVEVFKKMPHAADFLWLD